MNAWDRSKIEQAEVEAELVKHKPSTSPGDEPRCPECALVAPCEVSLGLMRRIRKYREVRVTIQERGGW